MLDYYLIIRKESGPSSYRLILTDANLAEGWEVAHSPKAIVDKKIIKTHTDTLNVIRPANVNRLTLLK